MNVKYKYIIISEDGEAFKSNTISDTDKQLCDDGVLEIIDVVTGKTYFEDRWMDLDLWKS